MKMSIISVIHLFLLNTFKRSQRKIFDFFKRKEPFETVETEEEEKGPLSKNLCLNSEHDHKNI